MIKEVHMPQDLFVKFFTKGEKIAYKILEGLPKDSKLLGVSTLTYVDTVVLRFRSPGDGPEEEINIKAEAPVNTSMLMEKPKNDDQLPICD